MGLKDESKAALKDKKDKKGKRHKNSKRSSSSGSEGSDEGGARNSTKVRELKKRLLELKAMDPRLTPADQLKFAARARENRRDKDKAKGKVKKKSKRRAKSRSRSRARRRKDSSVSKSASGDESSTELALFTKAPFRQGENPIKEMSTKTPGRLYSNAVSKVEKLLGG